MAEPGARVVGHESDSQIPVPGKGRDVAARRVLGLEVLGGGGGVKGTRGLVEDPEVVAVQVDGVFEAEVGLVLDDEDDPFVVCCCFLCGKEDMLVRRFVMSDEGGEVREEEAYVDGEDIVVSGEQTLAVEHLLQGRVGPIDDQTAGVNGPVDIVDLLRDIQVRVEALLDVGDVDLEVGDK